MTIDCIRPPSLSDFELLRQYVEHHSQPAFPLLYDRHYERVCKICRHNLHDRHLAEDATQQVFVALASHAKNLTPGPLEGYLAMLALRICDKMTKARKTFPKHEKGYREALRIMRIEGCPDARHAKIQEFLQELTADQREILEFRYELRLEIGEIALKSGLTRSTVYKRLERALDALHDCFDHEDIEKEYAKEIALLRAMGAEKHLSALVEALDAGRDDLDELIDALERVLPPTTREEANRITRAVLSEVAAERAAGGDLSKLDPQLRERILVRREAEEWFRQEEEERRKKSLLSAKSGAD